MNPPTRIVITNFGHRLNKGSAALLNSTVSALRGFLPNSEFSVFTYYPEIENEVRDIKIFDIIAKRSKSKILQVASYILGCTLWSILYNCFRLDIRKLRNKKGLSEYYSADIVMNTGGDVLTEDYGTLSFFFYTLNLLFALLLNKSVVLYAESIGPFKRWWNKIVAKFLLNRVKLVILREGSSKKCLEKLEINKIPVYVTADPAFLLEPASMQRIKEILEKEEIKENDRPLIGISASKIISLYGFRQLDNPSDKYFQYIKIMAKISDYLIINFKATVIFVPHVIGLGNNDDRIVADDIYELIENKQKVISIKNEYTAEETKGIIGQCDLFIGARMHATIASTCMHVPTVAVAYSHKMHGIIGKMMGYEQYVLDINDFNYNTSISVIDKAWSNRIRIREELKLKIKDIRQRALLSAKLVKELIESI